VSLTARGYKPDRKVRQYSRVRKSL